MDDQFIHTIADIACFFLSCCYYLLCYWTDLLWLLAIEYYCCKFQFLLVAMTAYLMLIFVALPKLFTATNHHTYVCYCCLAYIWSFLLKFLKLVLIESNGQIVDINYKNAISDSILCQTPCWLTYQRHLGNMLSIF